MFRRTRLRIGAYLIDIVLLFAVLAPLGQLVLRLLLKQSPATGPEIWRTTLFNFSIPCWLYFILSARSKGGATLGQRWLGIRVLGNQGPVSTPRAIIRTAVLLLPWELIHVSAFGLSRQLGRFDAGQWVGVGAANLLTIIYLVVTFATQGRRSVHDVVAGTAVDFVNNLAGPPGGPPAGDAATEPQARGSDQ